MAKISINDVHSQLNSSYVNKIELVSSIEDIRQVIFEAKEHGKRISIASGRHAMGGQQFAEDSILIDMSKMNNVLNFDKEKGLIEVEAGIQWPKLISHYLKEQESDQIKWAIAQKQTGADDFSIGGTISANAHGRGLTMKPFIENLESVKIIDYNGQLLRCSREESPELFSLVVGGYGLFGVVVSAVIRLVRRSKIQRIVEIAVIDDLMRLFDKHIREGCLYGDFQFAINPDNDNFLRSGICSIYKPVDNIVEISSEQKELSREDWYTLAYLAHADKDKAYEVYVSHYLKTSGQYYWSDLTQLSTYLGNYHKVIDAKLDETNRGTEMITELYIPREKLLDFIDEARQLFRQSQANIIYGTIRLIKKEEDSFLRWASQSWVCIVFNLHISNNEKQLVENSEVFRKLIDLAIKYQGSYYLTYHRFATKEQLKKCYPQFREFLNLKIKYDPMELFQSNWYVYYKDLFEGVK